VRSLFKFVATNVAIMPTLQPTLVMIEPDRFDPNLNEKRGPQIGRRIRVRGQELLLGAYEIKPGSGYDPATFVIVGLIPTEAVFMATVEWYVFRREDWEKVRAVAIDREGIAAAP
jgi:hypothetical protein